MLLPWTLFYIQLSAFLHCNTAEDPYIWPLPMQYSVNNNLTILISNSFTMKQMNGDNSVISNAINRYMSLIFAHSTENSPASNSNPVSLLNINISDPSNTNLQYGMDESYQLQFPNENNEGQLNSVTIWGALRGLETFSQIITYNFTQGYYQSYEVYIDDKPRFKWRGVLIDTARHFLSVPKIKTVIDAIAYAKYNVLHWHITDATSFPYESKAYPKLWNGAFTAFERYSQNDVKEIVQYAYERGIRLIPEFDMPGHSRSWCSYPEICPIASCNNKTGSPAGGGVLNPAANMTYNVIGALIAEANELFIDDWIHLGGDEVSTNCWTVDPSINQWLIENNFNTTQAELYFDNRVQNIAYYDNGKQVIRWVEVFDLFGNQINTSYVTIQVWKSETDLKNVVASGFKAILSDHDAWYLNNVNIEWQTAYKNEPYDNINNVTQQNLILGGEACVWGNYIDGSDIGNTMWPRGAAIAERLWSPKDVNSVELAEPRYAYFRCVLLSRGVDAAPYNNTQAAQPPHTFGSCETLRR